MSRTGIAPRTVIGRRIATCDPAVTERTRQAKLRRALYAACERAPLGWENRHG